MIKVKLKNPELVNFIGSYNSLEELKNVILDAYVDYIEENLSTDVINELFETYDYFDEKRIDYYYFQVDDNELIEEIKKLILKFRDEDCILIFRTVSTYPYRYEYVDCIYNNELSKYENKPYYFFIEYNPNKIDEYDIDTLLKIFSSL